MKGNTLTKATRQVPLTALLQSAQYLPNLERGIQGWLVNQIEVYKKMNPQLIYRVSRQLVLTFDFNS